MGTFNYGAQNMNRSLFGGSTTSSFGTNQSENLQASRNHIKDSEVDSPPDDSIAALSFSPRTVQRNFLIAGSWDNQVRCWEIQQAPNSAQLQSVPLAQQSHQGPVLDVAWSDDGSRVFSASCDKTVKMWDLNSNQFIEVAKHEAPVKTVHWIKTPKCSFIMTGSWDKTLKFWDLRTPNAMLTIDLPERCYCADVYYPMAVVATANKGVQVYSLENTPQLYKPIESPLKFQSRCVSIFPDKNRMPFGFALGGVDGRVGIQCINSQNRKDNFTFKCHRSNETTIQDIYAVNDVAFHPQNGILATVGSNGRFSFWDVEARKSLKMSEQMEQAITRCCFSARGDIFAYAVSYDWSKGHEFYNPQKKNSIFLHNCYESLKSVTQK